MSELTNDAPHNNRPGQPPGRYYQQALREQQLHDRSPSPQLLTSSRPLPPLPNQRQRHNSAPTSSYTPEFQCAFTQASFQNVAPTYTPFIGYGDDMAGTSNNSNAFQLVDTSFNSRGPNSVTGSQITGAGIGGPGNVNNNTNYMVPLPVGHQQDLNYLYAQIQELSGVLQSNRERVNNITRTAEEVARRAGSTNGTTAREPNIDLETSRVRTLEHDLSRARATVELYKHEQTENTKLIAMYEDALGTATDQIRNYCNDVDGRFLAQRRHYNNLLQAEKDEHLASRLDRDQWHAKTLRCCEMLRTAYRLRCEEDCDEFRVVSGLQTEVRCLRRCLGMEDEKPEEETGWEVLKHAPKVD